LKQYVDRPSGEPARRQACRSDVSAVAVEAFVNNAGYGDDRIGPSVANIVSPDSYMLNPGLVTEGWCWWYRKYAPGDTVLEGVEKEARNEFGVRHEN
jgi:micrococcal nuclease